MKHKKKNRSKASVVSGSSVSESKKGGEGVLNGLTDALSTVSVKEAGKCVFKGESVLNDALSAVSVKEAGKCGYKEALMETCSSSSRNAGSSSYGSSSNSDEVFVHNSVQERKSAKTKKKLIAAAGTVSTIIGKDYVRSSAKKISSKTASNEDVEQFLCSMLGEDSELSLAVVRDVLCQCGYEVEKALSVLLELSASSNEQPKCSGYSSSSKEELTFLNSSDGLTDGASDSTSLSSESEFQDNAWFWGPPGRNHSKVAGNTTHSSSSTFGNFGLEVPQEILESLFSMPTPKGIEHEPSTMNWKNVVKKMTSLGQKFESCPNDIPQDTQEGAEYQLYREASKQHWESMKSHYQKAATAFSTGQKEYAAYLADKGRLHNRKAHKANEKASQDIFAARNKNIENIVTIDLHGQHVKPAMRLMKLHLLFGAYVRSVRMFRVITGCGSHGVGKSKLKNSVINLLQKEHIEWTEENRGTVLIKLNGHTNFSFLDSDSDDDGDNSS